MISKEEQLTKVSPIQKGGHAPAKLTKGYTGAYAGWESVHLSIHGGSGDSDRPGAAAKRPAP